MTLLAEVNRKLSGLMQRKLIGHGFLDGVRTVVYEVHSEPGEVGAYHSHEGFTTLTVVDGVVLFETWDGTKRKMLVAGESQTEPTTLHRVTDMSKFGSHMVVTIQHAETDPPMKDEKGNAIYI